MMTSYGIEVNLTDRQLLAARQTIRRHYSITDITDQQIYEEIANLKRKNGDFDNLDGELAAALEVRAGISFDEKVICRGSRA